MAYDNIKIFVSSAIKKIIFSWTLFFIFNIAFMIVYNTNNDKIKAMDKQILDFSEIGTEATSVLYYNSQKNIASEINYEKTLLNQWVVSNQKEFVTIIPNSLPETTLLEKLGKEFYSEENLKANNNSVENFQNLSDQLNLLKRLANNYLDNSILMILTMVFIPLSCLLLLLLIIMTLLISKNLQRKILSKNEYILEDIWTELQDIEFNMPSSQLSQALHEINIPNAYSSKMNMLIVETKNITMKTNTIKEALRIYYGQLQNFTMPTTTVHTQDPQTQEKILMIQKLLSRLFTRAERASSLAKASSENGFQAGILALNISIEAARVGNAGKNFVPISDRVKDFAEKSSQIGNAILEELKDANLSIRKAYAVGKGIVEIVPPQTSITPSDHNHHLPDTSELYNILEACDSVVLLTQHVQKLSLDLESALQTPLVAPQDTSLNKNNSFLKAILVRSFERLYRLNYGIDPPSHEKNDFSNDI